MTEFDGFPREVISFIGNLRKNNSTGWFNAHRDDYERYYLEPSRAFVMALGPRLHELAPDIIYDPKVNRSLFRLNRDTRFSKDKTPYKTHLALWFWEGAGKRMEYSGFYFHLEPERFMLGAGIYRFTREQLAVYRERVADAKHGAALERAIATVTEAGDISIGGEHYKRVPRGYDADHPRAGLLRYDGLYAGTDGPVPEELFSAAILDYCIERVKPMLPLHEWLVRITESV